MFSRLFLLILGVFGGWMAAALAVKHAVPSRGGPESDEVALMAVFDGAVLKSESKAFRGGSMLAWYGGVDADLRRVTLAPGARLTVATLFGGVALRVPPEWRVKTSLRAIAGGCEVSGEDPDDPEAPLLEIDGVAFCGGVAVSRKPVEAST